MRNRTCSLCFFLAALVLFSPLAICHALAAQAAQKVPVKAINITGNTAITSKEFDPIVAPFLGTAMDLADLRRVADLITEEYRKKGYNLARAIVPEQDITRGVVEIRVLEGTVGDIVVKGNTYYSTDLIKRNFARVVGDKAIRQSSLEKTIVLLNEYPDLKATSVLRAGREPGSTNIEVNVQDKVAAHLALDYNNFGTKQVSRHLFGAEFGVVEPRWGSDFSVRGVFGFDPEETTFYRLGYNLPINNYGTKLSLFHSAGEFDVGREFAVLDIEGESLSYGFSFTHPFIRTRFQKLTGEIGFELKDTELDLLATTFSRDRIRLVRAGLVYDVTDGTGRNLASFYLYQGLGTLFGGMKDNDLTPPTSSRIGGKNSDRAAGGEFTRFRLDLARLQRISDSFAFLARASGHYSSAPLVVSEEFTVGGPDSVRGYPVREARGDDGYNVSGELRVSPLPNKELAQLVFFIDHGAASIKNPAPAESSYNDLTGAGPGLRLNLSSDVVNFNFRFDVGFPIKPSRASTGDEPTYYLQAVLKY